jgi:DNA-binding PadR family transcriptional regulator
MYSTELLKGTLQALILKLLSEQDKMYGYQLTQAIKEQSGGKITITEAAIYPILHKLKAEGVLTTEKVNIGERVRIYYSLTEQGNAKAKEKIAELSDFLRTMQTLIQLKPSF